MFESVLNPVYWWGATAVSAPIIIHLINRLRYRRVHWAAMEFLLKSQQRNRRKLILKQLLLLLMRCLLVMLVVLLIVRPTWLLGEDSGRAADLPTYHVFAIDDTLSMQDLENPKDQTPLSAFKAGSQLIHEMVKKFSEQTSTHYVTVLPLSDPKNPLLGRGYEQLDGEPPGQLVTTDEVQKLRDRLDGFNCSFMPLSPLRSVQEANRLFENVKKGQKQLHLISDYRRRDWSESDSDELCQLLVELARANKVQVRLHDVASPRRTINRDEVPPAHPNIGITNLVAKPRGKGASGEAVRSDRDQPVRIVTPGVPIYLHATVKNFSDMERTGLRLSLKVDGSDKSESARVLDRLSGGEEKVVVLDISFTDEERTGLKRLSVQIDDPEKFDHLPADNARHTYLELRKEIPVLIVEPDADSGDTATVPDSFYLINALTGNPRFSLKPTRIRPSEVKHHKNLERYSVIYLLNVAGMGTQPAEVDPEGLRLLEEYAGRGGSLVWFLGPRLNIPSYYTFFYKNGKGIFPVLLPPADQSKGPVTAEDPPDDRDLSPKIRFLKTGHPAFPFEGELAKQFAEYLNINKYYRVNPDWKPGDGASVIVQLANRRPLDAYRNITVEISKELDRDGGRFKPLRTYAHNMIDWVLLDPELKRAQKGPLIEAVANALNDPELAEYWADPNRKALRTKVEKFYEELTTGDPLVIEAELNTGKIKGHAMVFLTPAGPTPLPRKEYGWNNFANNLHIQYVLTQLYLHSYMAAKTAAATETDIDRLILPENELRLDKEKHDPRIQLWYQGEGQNEAVKVDDIVGVEDGKEIVARIKAVRGPGHYLLRLNQPPADGSYVPKGEPEERPLAFNVDNRREGLLTRVAETEVRDRLALGLQKGQLKLAVDESQAFVNSLTWFPLNALDMVSEESVRNKSWSDYSWVLLAFIGLLLFEGFLAMKFSHHLKGGEALAPPQAQRRSEALTAP